MSPGEPEQAERAGAGAARALAAGAAWGWLAAFALAAGEWSVVVFRSAGYDWGGPLPLDLLAASFGELVFGQALLAVPVCAAAAALGGARGQSSPAPMAAAITLLAGSAFTLVAHGGFESHLGRLEVIALALIALAGARAIHALAQRTPAPRAAWVASAVVAAAGLAALARSPLFDPGAIGVPAPVSASAPAPMPARPHVLWIVLDTVRADRTSLHGYARETTPFLARWGAGARVFDHAVADGTWTSPSHASMFTGLPVRAHGVGRTTVHLAARFRTVAETLAEAGYATASFSNNPLIGSGSGLARGFATWRIPSRLAALGASAAEIWVHRFGVAPALPFWSRDQGAAVTNQQVAAWLDGRDAGQPLFLFVNYMEAHLPWEIPERQLGAFLDDAGAARSRVLRRRAFGDLERALNQRVAREGPGFLSAGDRQVLSDLYDGTLHYLDARVEELVGEFAARGLLEHTLVVVTSDHGEYLGEHDLWSHLYGTYDDLTDVVLAVRPPGSRDGRRSRAAVQLSDLHPTVLLHTLGAESGADASRDLLGAGGQEGTAPRFAISEAGALGARSGTAGDAFRMADTVRGRRLAQPEVAIQDDRFKLVRPHKGSAELYDRQRDPGETRNVLAQHGVEARRLAGELRRFERRVPAYQPSLADLAPDPEVQRALRELGYLED